MMNRKSAIANAKANLAKQRELAASGGDFSSSVIMESERIVSLAERFNAILFPSEKARLKAKALSPNTDWSDCKDIKDRARLSWNEVKMIANWCAEQPVKIYREDKGLTQKALSEAAGISIKTLQDYESGRKDINGAAASTVKLLAKALGCKMEDLID